MTYTDDDGIKRKFTKREWDTIILLDFVNQFFWIVMDEMLGEWKIMLSPGSIDLNYWDNRLEIDFNECMK